MKELSINELIELNSLLSQCNNDRDLKNPSTIITGIRLSKSIASNIKRYFEEQEDIFKKFNVVAKENENGKYFTWDDKPDDEKESINKAVAELNSSKYKTNYLNEIDEDDFVIYSRGLNNSQVIFLFDYLVNEKPL